LELHVFCFSQESVLKSVEVQQQNIKAAEKHLLKLKPAIAPVPQAFDPTTSQMHVVKPTDTLAGIAIKYGNLSAVPYLSSHPFILSPSSTDVSIAALRSANKMFGDTLHGRSQLIIPAPLPAECEPALLIVILCQ
jgi:hypothetical protein